MDSLVPAFIAALIAGIGDRPARLAALLGTGRGVLAGFAVGTAAIIALSIAGATVIAPLLTPAARSILLGIALILSGLGGFWSRRIERPGGPPALAALTGSFVASDSTAFLAFAFAVKGSAPMLAGVGAFAGATVLATAAAVLGPGWPRLPLVALGRAGGALLLVVGLFVALGGLRIV